MLKPGRGASHRNSTGIAGFHAAAPEAGLTKKGYLGSGGALLILRSPLWLLVKTLYLPVIATEDLV